jgi:copper transporter 1
MAATLLATSLVLAWAVKAQHQHGGSGSDGVIMIPWLHFEGGDALWFESWRPASKGAIAGAAIGLFVFAIFERWVAAMRGLMEVHWRRQ